MPVVKRSLIGEMPQHGPGNVVFVVEVVVVAVVVVVAPPPQTMLTKLPPLTAAIGSTQLDSTWPWMPDAFPSPAQPLTLLNAAVNFAVAFEMQAGSTGRLFAAAFEMQPSSPEASLPAAFRRAASHLLGFISSPSGSAARMAL